MENILSAQMIMGNQAIALGALAAGVNLAAGYPGTPSSEIIEFIAKYRKETGAYVEWSVNEKAAVEVAAGTSYAGGRTLVTMKQVGLNVASDPVMCLSYVGVKGGMVIVSADDPGPISSQTEQDTRHFASYSKLPCFDPSTPKEAFEMVQAAFEYSEKYHTPVLLRPTTRVDHAYQSMEIPSLPKAKEIAGFEKDSKRWVIFPRASFLNHQKIFERNLVTLPEDFSKSKFNYIEENGQPDGKKGIAASGISWEYVKEALSLIEVEHEGSTKNLTLMKIGTPYPFPEPTARDFLEQALEVLVVEELDPILEDSLIYVAGKSHLPNTILGKNTGHIARAGENTVASVKEAIESFLGIERTKEDSKADEIPPLPVRPPVLCAGCPHRASFYAVKQAMKKEKTVYCGDIGCYTLGNAAPLDMCDTCLCMGADITMAQGFFHAEPDRKCFSFIGDSTFFASGITGVVNAVYNQAKITLCILDNSTTAMTGHQPHPGTGLTMMGNAVEKISMEKILEAVGVSPVITVDAFNLKETVEAVKKASEAESVSAVIFKGPCIAIAQKLGFKAQAKMLVDDSKCIGCKKCISELGCPAITFSTDTKKALIEKSLCTGCTLCSQVCPVKAIVSEGGDK
ncbi:MAG: indolepyruvate ferredoxin oxidoreductase subunit alpha [Treponema sp.]|nr:indolepyruvate ferredoxin oxidoreductase subunit alpha [Treponema sp.]